MAGSGGASTSGRSGTTRRNIDADNVLDDSDDSSDDKGEVVKVFCVVYLNEIGIVQNAHGAV